MTAIIGSICAESPGRPRGAALALVLLVGACATAPTFSAGETEHPEARLAALGLALPEPPAPIANYVPAVRTGNLVFLAGHGECGPGLRGKVGSERAVEEAYASARDVGLCLLASLKKEIGDLAKVRRVVRVFGMVNSAEGFTDQPKVINGCSDLLVAVFGERGRHARAAVGVASLPLGLSVEIEMVVEVAD